MPSSGNDAGTCQGCFKQQRTRSGLLVLHGYKRPGHGYILGNCWGYHFDPYEVSCERTKQFLAECVRPALARFEERLAKLQAKPESVSYEAQVWVGYGHPRSSHRSGYAPFFVKVPRGAAQGIVDSDIILKNSCQMSGDRFREAGEKAPAWHPGYDRALERAVTEVQGQIRACREHVDFLDQKVSEWKPVPWPAKKTVASGVT